MQNNAAINLLSVLCPSLRNLCNRLSLLQHYFHVFFVNTIKKFVVERCILVACNFGNIQQFYDQGANDVPGKKGWMLLWQEPLLRKLVQLSLTPLHKNSNAYH